MSWISYGNVERQKHRPDRCSARWDHFGLPVARRVFGHRRTVRADEREQIADAGSGPGGDGNCRILQLRSRLKCIHLANSLVEVTKTAGPRAGGFCYTKLVRAALTYV